MAVDIMGMLGGLAYAISSIILVTYMAKLVEGICIEIDLAEAPGAQ